MSELRLLLVQLHDLFERRNLKEVHNFLLIGVEERSVSGIIFRVLLVCCILMLTTLSCENIVNSTVSWQKVSSHTHLISLMEKLKFEEIERALS